APLTVGHNLQRVYRLLVVGQRFAHPHENDMRDAPVAVERSTGFENLIDDFACREISLETQYRGGAKGAAKTAAHLRRNTKRQPARLRNQHAFDAGAVTETEEKFDRAVACFRTPQRL